MHAIQKFTFLFPTFLDESNNINPFERRDDKRYLTIIVVDLCVDIFFLFDIIVNFRTTYIGKNDALVTDPKKIAIRYLSTYFIVDLVAAIPWDLIAIPAFEVIISYSLIQWNPVNTTTVRPYILVVSVKAIIYKI